ncbi:MULTISPECIES: ferredoxin [unclassified Amycolatopsis]|uniref:ferredoxin n=1 Tax=unclassified Amycolatopsis TaxID=2618356 RepID=UPI002876FFCF|nr:MULTISPECIES: ferredoxin [unclassified Amycolatopsis]MDS0131865.1 ferredoxin [Amycolatopsis sp. 505]MDS0141397.1 ferredoxin [Amycolatopsis sp. CM201R]
MKISVDHARCEGHGLCTEQAPAIFDFDDEAELVHHFEGTDIPPEQLAAARAAVTSCPVAALRELP